MDVYVCVQRWIRASGPCARWRLEDKWSLSIPFSRAPFLFASDSDGTKTRQTKRPAYLGCRFLWWTVCLSAMFNSLAFFLSVSRNFPCTVHLFFLFFISLSLSLIPSATVFPFAVHPARTRSQRYFLVIIIIKGHFHDINSSVSPSTNSLPYICLIHWAVQGTRYREHDHTLPTKWM